MIQCSYYFCPYINKHNNCELEHKDLLKKVKEIYHCNDDLDLLNKRLNILDRKLKIIEILKEDIKNSQRNLRVDLHHISENKKERIREEEGLEC